MFRAHVKEYYTSVRGLALELVEAISESLGLDKDYIGKQLGKHGQHMALDYYPPCPQPDLTYGFPGHTDLNLITILLQDDVSGLQVLKDGKWVVVDPVPNTFIINIGDQIQVLSNDKYKSILHRAVGEHFGISGKLNMSQMISQDIARGIYPGTLPQDRVEVLGEKLVSWSSKKQDCMALSTAEAEYVSLSACCAQVLWMQTQLTDYGFHFNKILIYCDSKSAIAISCNLVQYSRTKHIAVRYHFIKENIEKGTIELYFVKTNYQLADIFTKALPTDRFNYLVRRLGMRSLSPKELERLAKSQ
nr:protein DMR6-like oxygenase 2-like [Tanacetum cinerariifolium]